MQKEPLLPSARRTPGNAQGAYRTTAASIARRAPRCPPHLRASRGRPCTAVSRGPCRTEDTPPRPSKEGRRRNASLGPPRLRDRHLSISDHHPRLVLSVCRSYLQEPHRATPNARTVQSARAARRFPSRYAPCQRSATFRMAYASLRSHGAQSQWVSVSGDDLQLLRLGHALYGESALA